MASLPTLPSPFNRTMFPFTSSYSKSWEMVRTYFFVTKGLVQHITFQVSGISKPRNGTSKPSISSTSPWRLEIEGNWDWGKLLDFERSPPFGALSGMCGVICIWGGPLGDLRLQLSEWWKILPLQFWKLKLKIENWKSHTVTRKLKNWKMKIEKGSSGNWKVEKLKPANNLENWKLKTEK